MGRTLSMEIRAVRDMMQESPPPPPKDVSLREWFAGLALLSTELMKDVPIERRVVEAVRIADQLVAALVAPRALTDMEVPSTSELEQWGESIAAQTAAMSETTERTMRATNPAIPRPALRPSRRPPMVTIPPPPSVSTAAIPRHPTQRFAAVLPDPAIREVGSKLPQNRRGLPANSSYSCLGEGSASE